MVVKNGQQPFFLIWGALVTAPEDSPSVVATWYHGQDPLELPHEITKILLVNKLQISHRVRRCESQRLQQATSDGFFRISNSWALPAHLRPQGPHFGRFGGVFGQGGLCIFLALERFPS